MMPIIGIHDQATFVLKPVLHPATAMKLLYIFIAAPLLFNLVAPSAFAATTAEMKKLEDFKKLESTGKCASCDLSGTSFVGIDFTGISVDLRDANLNGANFAGAIMPKANLSGVSAVGANFLGADLQGATLRSASLIYSNLVKVKLNNAVLDITDLQGANLVEADLRGAKVTKTDFVGANIYRMQYSPAIKDPVLGNYFKDEKKGIRVAVQSGAIETSKPVGDNTYESSGGRTSRRFRIPSWMGYQTTSTSGSYRYYNPQDPSLTLELW
jgi:uncharacterized protein YjbI with pentapeptide repeats